MGLSGQQTTFPFSAIKWVFFQITLAQSLIRNRPVIENALLRLRSEKFEFKGVSLINPPPFPIIFKGNELMYIWDPHWWTTIDNIHAWLSPLQRSPCPPFSETQLVFIAGTSPQWRTTHCHWVWQLNWGCQFSRRLWKMHENLLRLMSGVCASNGEILFFAT